MAGFRDFIGRETLAVTLREVPEPKGDKTSVLELDEGKLTLAVERS